MLNPWLALETGADASERAGQVRRAHEEFLARGAIGKRVRDVVADSWRRCAGALVEPESVARIDLADADLESYRAQHPLVRVMPLFRELLGTVADDGAHLLSVCDESGRMLWIEGHAQLLRRAEGMNFVPGARWGERFIGTNAPGTALAVDHAVQIFSAEHYCLPVQPWTCAAAPIHDPRTRRLLGAIDITGGDHLAAPQSLALVQATARAAEAYLAELSPAPGAPSLTALGRDEALLDTGTAGSARAAASGEGPGPGTPQRLGRRHSEIMLLLAAHPDGLTGEQLGLELYGERAVTAVTLRAELSRLRGMLGPLLDSRPYRLRRRLTTDYEAVGDAVTAGDLSAALAVYRGPLLPLSEAPGVVRLRRLLEDRLRRALLRRGDPELLEEWVSTPRGEDDLEVWEGLLAARPGSGPGHTALLSRVRELRGAYGLEGPDRLSGTDHPGQHG